MTLSDAILIGTTLILGGVAIFVAIWGPLLSEQKKQKSLAPKLTIRYHHGFPNDYKVVWFNPLNPIVKQDVHFFSL